MSKRVEPIWIGGDPYVFDNEGELIELHHGERPS